MSDVDFGTDVSCDDDMDEQASDVSGIMCYAQALFGRLITPRGDLIDDPNYGFGVDSYLDKPYTPRLKAIMCTGMDAEFLKDERTLSSVTEGVFTKVSASQWSAVFTSIVTPANGQPPFKLVVSVDSVTVALLAVETLPDT